jgi:hypothetical protein
VRQLLLLVMTASLLSGPAVRGQVVFRSNADEVLVDVSVMRGKSPVAGLTAADFVVTDNGVRQTIREVVPNAGDIDVTLVIQREGVLSSVLTDSQGRFAGIRAEAAARSIDAAEVDVRRLIQPADGLRVLTADDQVGRGDNARPEAGVPPRPARPASAILDGLVAAMMLKPTEAGRRQLVVGITGGTDNRSFVAVSNRVNVALRTDAVVHIIAFGHGQAAYALPAGRNGTGTVSGIGIAGAPLEPIAAATGGRLYQVEPGTHVEKVLRPAIEEFRARYLLRYVPSGVPRPGWHDIVVTVPSGSYEIRHRRGYEVR